MPTPRSDAASPAPPIAAFFAVWVALAAAPLSGSDVDYVNDVRPILQQHCYSCHGEANQKSGLRLDIKSEALRGGDGWGPSLVEGEPDESPLIELITSEDEDSRMPPGDQGLSAAEIETLTQWIAQGALWPDGVDLAVLEDRLDHWSFKPPVPVEVPALTAADWPRHPIDQFVLSRLEEGGLHPAPPAEPIAWLRRVTLDLTGLPPTQQDVIDFQQQAARGETAYTEVVERLLKSPRYGERWAQHWLDVVRYADTHGFEVNTERQHAWPYRDYVIESMNDDTPYDQFIREQIVGDALGQDAATGFLVTASVLLPGQIGQDEPSKRLARQDSLDEIVNNISLSFLGLSVGCARCHDHKFDPITAKDYYSMQAFVAGVEYADREWHSEHRDALKRDAVVQRQRLAEIDVELAAFEQGAGIDLDPMQTLSQVPPVNSPADSTVRLPPDEKKLFDELIREKQSLAAKIKASESVPLVFAGQFRTPDDIHLLSRGDPEQPQQPVSPAVLSAIGDLELPSDTVEQERRRQLAAWIASPDNPMTARVMVNRIWQWHFGIGFVDTPNDFGRNGSKPTHPQLLDWLALEFIRSGWSIKHMHRLIVTSATYRQSTQFNPEAAAKDADARLLWRYPSRRLEAEAIRDSMLAINGRLNLTMGGRGFDLFNQRGGLSGFTPVESFEGDGLRRMIYAHKVRRERDAVFGALDCPDGGQSAARRIESTTPIQALNLFNSRFTIEQSHALASVLIRQEGDDVAAQVEQAYWKALNRYPDSDESAAAVSVVAEHGLTTLCRALFNCNEFLFYP